MRYEEIEGWADILGGFGGKKDTAKEAINFLSYWFNDGVDGNPKGVIIQIIDAVTAFFNELSSLFKS